VRLHGWEEIGDFLNLARFGGRLTISDFPPVYILVEGRRRLITSVSTTDPFLAIGRTLLVVGRVEVWIAHCVLVVLLDIARGSLSFVHWLRNHLRLH
jgi:hypothetical protein